ncbi:hypothetical protein [Kaistella rhinocerotis]|jgi:hypothetical protein|uniref:hypothetical protein n=1 Tax=Kaistella rhinocerotis TaxID=3026437 RepID=UPI002553EA1B|nr:hypothetical protein [Kaistella sp. Ran72]
MKNLFISLLAFGCTLLSAQVGINTRTPHASAALDISANNKGVSFPKVALLSKTDVTSVSNPKESLIIYNTNTSDSGNEGYYFWNGSRWDYFFSDLNQANLLNQVKYYSATSSTGYTFTSSQFLGYSAHAYGETINTSQWTVISSITKNIVVDRAQNQVLMNINGMYQANNGSSATGGITSTIGFFVDDKLIDVKPMFLDFASSCAFRQFMIYGVANNLTVGNHTVKFAIRNIEAPAISGLTVTYGAPNTSSSCNTISAFESAISSTIFVNQPYVF